MLKKSWPKANDALCFDLGTLEMIIPKQVGVMAEPRKKRTQIPTAKVIVRIKINVHEFRFYLQHLVERHVNARGVRIFTSRSAQQMP